MDVKRALFGAKLPRQTLHEVQYSQRMGKEGPKMVASFKLSQRQAQKEAI